MTILLDEGAGLAPKHLRLITERRVKYYKFVRTIIQRLKDEGKLRDLDVTIATHNLMGQLQWLPRWYTPVGRLNREQLIEGFTQAALTALLRARIESTRCKKNKADNRQARLVEIVFAPAEVRDAEDWLPDVRRASLSSGSGGAECL